MLKELEGMDAKGAVEHVLETFYHGGTARCNRSNSDSCIHAAACARQGKGHGKTQFMRKQHASVGICFAKLLHRFFRIAASCHGFSRRKMDAALAKQTEE